METSMSSHRISGCVSTDEHELVNLQRGLPHPLPIPAALPPIWQDFVVEASGYAFGWGQLIELANGLEDPVAPCGGGTSWRVIPTSLWEELKPKARAAGCSWSRILKHAHSFSAALLAARAPVWMVCRDVPRCFLGEMVTVGEADAERARRWLSETFLRRDIGDVIRRYRADLLKSMAFWFEVKQQRPMKEARQ
jgi:hypothetical protein